MVLRTLALAVALLGCKQSLFDSHGDDTTGDAGNGGDGAIATTCPAPCLGDGGANFDGTPMGTDGHWRYVEDGKNRTWAAMTAAAGGFVGAVAGNTIKSCTGASAAACSTLPGALLVSTAGGAGAVSAVEWIAPMNRVVQLQLGVRLPSGAASQTVRLYRSSREDSLFTAIADPGVTVTKTLTLDVLAGERIYITLDGDAVTDAAVQFFIVGDQATFPATCQVALGFSTATGNAVDNLCAATKFTFNDYTASTMIPPVLGAGPFTEEGMAAQFVVPRYFDSPNPLPRTGDFTVQYWAKLTALVDTSTGAWTFSDLDLNAGGGLGMVLFEDAMTSHLAISIQSCTDPNSNPLGIDEIDAQYPQDGGWHFVRVVHAGSDVSLCVDGAKLGGKTFTHTLASTYPPHLGKNVVWTPQDPGFNGALDDVRVISQALPCN